jgi:hypothetical protein
MNKRIIDVDALLKWVAMHAHTMYCEDMMQDYRVVLESYLIEKIDELSTPTPVAQEGDEVNKSNYDLDKPKNFMGCFMKKSVTARDALIIVLNGGVVYDEMNAFNEVFKC